MTTPDDRSSTEVGPSDGLAAGLIAQLDSAVTDADTAQALGSGDVPVLGTPRVLALVEAATVAATRPHLGPGKTSVGTRVELEHLAATPVGRTVVAQARLVSIDGQRMTFEVSLTDGQMLAARGRVERMIVDRERFLRRALGA